jgi:putative transcriptional regulator
MSKRAFDKIAAGLSDAIAIAKGELEPARLVVPVDVDLKTIRARTGFSQEQFAQSFGFTLTQIRDWEQGRARPTGGNRAYLLLIGDNPAHVREMLEQATGKAA